METIATLGREHQELLAQLGSLEARMDSGDPGADLAGFLSYLQRDVVLHLSVEERALFPILARHLNQEQGPLAVMNAEHAALRTLLDGLDTGVRSGDRERQRACAHDIIELLRAHIVKEDEVLFPIATHMLNSREWDEVNVRAAAVRLGSTS